MIRKKRSRSAGFTLVELLVSIAIIGILVAFLAGGIMHWVETQNRRNTEAAMRTIYSAFMRHWDWVVADAKKDDIRSVSFKNPFPPQTGVSTDIIDASKDINGNPNYDRARIIWIKLRLMEAFPVNYDEITKAYTPGQYVNWPNPLAYIPKEKRRYMAAYKNLIANATPVTPAMTANTNIPAGAAESSACLLMALTTNRGGLTNDAGTLAPYIKDSDNDGIPELVDSWGNPFAFYRFPTDSQVLLSAIPSALKNNAPAFDPIDPKGYLLYDNINLRNSDNSFTPWMTPLGAKTLFDQMIHKRFQEYTSGVSSCWYTIPVLISSNGNSLYQVSSSGAPITSSFGLLPNNLPQGGAFPYQKMSEYTTTDIEDNKQLLRMRTNLLYSFNLAQ